jgi:hypothetical protein
MKKPAYHVGMASKSGLHMIQKGSMVHVARSASRRSASPIEVKEEQEGFLRILTMSKHFSVVFGKVQIQRDPLSRKEIGRKQLDGGTFNCEAADVSDAVAKLNAKEGGVDIDVSVQAVSQFE